MIRATFKFIYNKLICPFFNFIWKLLNLIATYIIQPIYQGIKRCFIVLNYFIFKAIGNIISLISSFIVNNIIKPLYNLINLLLKALWNGIIIPLGKLISSIGTAIKNFASALKAALLNLFH
jgi:hypothetical protein